MTYEEVIKKLESWENPRNIEGMARFGIRPKTKVLGIPIPVTRNLAKELKKKLDKEKLHELAQKLWHSGIHEAQILGGFLADAEKITEQDFEKLVKTFDSWDVVDQVCSACLDKTKFAYKKIFELAKRDEEFVKRTAFTLICCLSVHDKKMSDEKFLKFFPLIKKASNDERNFVKKAVNWALRQIGKRNMALNKKAVELAKELRQLAEKNNSKSAKWIASNALSELTNAKTIGMIKKRDGSYQQKDN